MTFSRLFFCCLLLFLISCGKKEVMLPVIEADGIGQAENHSSIWIFFEVSGQDTLAVLNKNNKLINTNWIFNIDRRLPMKEVIPLLQRMQEDRNKDSMHKKEGMVNYFSYADSKNQRISLLEFSQTEFVPADAVKDSARITPDSTCVINLLLLGEECRVGDRNYLIGDSDRISQTLKTCPDQGQARFRLAYGENLTYQDYLTAKAHLLAASLSLDNVEIVHTSK